MSEDFEEQDYDSNSINDDEKNNDSESETDNEENNNQEDNEDEENDEDVNEEEDGVEETKEETSLKKNNKSLKDIRFLDDDDNDDDDEESEEDSYLTKFNNNIIRNKLVDFHPETKAHNYIEIKTMSKVIRDDDGNIIDDLHKTIPFLTKYEKTRILGQRAKQIESGAKPFVKIPDNIINSYLIAQMELNEKKIPFIIRRPLPNGSSEYWKLSDLQIIN
jgi:DNA-directed RNA polymerase subunit K/omega